MAERLFVYGTLAPGQPNEHVLIAIGGTWEQASVKGRLRDRGWGAATGHPGLCLDPAGEEIGGFLFTSDRLEGHWQELDRFEGRDYERVSTQVWGHQSGPTEAHVYVLRGR